MSDELRVSERDGVVVATLNRPERRNALSEPLMAALMDLADDLAGQPGRARALVLRGAGPAFCAGGDIGWFRDGLQNGGLDPGAVAAANRRYGTVLSALDRLPVPVIAAVHGAAMGGGVGLACVADVTLAAPEAVFSLTETTLGLTPAQICAFVVDRIGAHQARRLMLTAARLPAEAAREVGLVDEVAEDLDAALDRVLRQVRRCAPEANALTKALIADTLSGPRDAVLDRAAEQFAGAMAGAEARAGVSAFLGKAAPPWA
jgi:isohexenylglutaconyl-CoA hydratase